MVSGEVVMIDWVKGKILSLFAPKYIGSVVRTALAAVAGYLAAKGFGDAGSIVQGMEEEVAALLFAIVQAWSLKQKK